MGNKEKMSICVAIDDVVSWLKSKGLDCVVLVKSRDGAYWVRSSMSKTYTWVLMNEALAELHQEIEQDGQSIGENHLIGKE